MQLKYGSYAFPVNGVTPQTHTVPQLNAAGMLMSAITTMTVSGDLLAPLNTTTPQTDLSAMQAALQAALSTPYQDLVFYADTGAVTATLLANAGSLSGVRLIDGPHFEEPRARGEYAVKRGFVFKMAVEYPSAIRASRYQSFRDSVSYSGGMPIRQMVRAVNLPPIDQIIWPYTEFEAVQSGEAVGFSAWPFGAPNAGPPLLFPVSTLRGKPEITPSGPDRIGPDGYKNYRIRWVIRYASATPLIAAPLRWVD